jgi:dCTP deaminase
MMGGIQSYQHLKRFVDEKTIYSNSPFNDWQFQANTIDLRLGPVVYRVRSSFISFTKSVEDKINELLMYELNLQDGAILEKGCVYIIPLQEKLSLPPNIYGKTNPKSSTGRLDIFTRIITDYNYKFNVIQGGYSGNLYVEVSPMSFTIKVRENDSLNQLRLIDGDNVRLSQTELENLYDDTPLLYDDNGHDLPKKDVVFNDGLFMRIDLSHTKEKRIIGFKSKKNSSVLDLRKKSYYAASQFWDTIYSSHSQKLILEPEVFYIFASKERIVIPPGVCGEMIPYDPDSGEMRVHYAGFFDTGFGYDHTESNTLKGAKAVLEVRPHDVPFLIDDGQILFRLVFDRNIKIPTKIYGKSLNSNYQYQGLSLSKHFK